MSVAVLATEIIDCGTPRLTVVDISATVVIHLPLVGHNPKISMIASCFVTIARPHDFFVLWIMVLIKAPHWLTVWVHFKAIIKINSDDNLFGLITTRSQLVSINSGSFPTQILSAVWTKFAAFFAGHGHVDKALFLLVAVTFLDPEVRIHCTRSPFTF